ncbi:Trp biosynthesis-associated membrane protein [Microbacterium koreense]|uniref:Trp biosynthesis-associated membrane protein n=1 Tax=Microbacterium koreense TaxID=323761 RepID=A0ABW2ZSG1_9MICO
MIRRARTLAVVVVLAVGALGIISSTQTWLTVFLDDDVRGTLDVSGADALPLLAPLSLATLALGAALTIVGIVLRYVFGALTLAIAALSAWGTLSVVTGPTTTHVASTVTEATGITGVAAVEQLVAGTARTPWPTVMLVAWSVLLVAGVYILVTAHAWRRTGRRYATAEISTTPTAGSRPHDAIDDWDELSRGEDPTTRPLD